MTMEQAHTSQGMNMDHRREAERLARQADDHKMCHTTEAR